MRSFFLCTSIILLITFVSGLSQSTPTSSFQHVKIKSYTNGLTTQQFFAEKMDELGIDTLSDFRLLKSHKSKHGTFHRYQHFYKGLEIVGRHIILHTDPIGNVLKSVGYLEPIHPIDTQPKLSRIDANQIGLQLAEQNILQIDELTSPSSIPNWKIEDNKLVILDRAYPSTSSSYQLAYAISMSDLQYTTPLYEVVYLDANTGKFLDNHSLVMSDQIIGTAHTQYYGTQEILVDSSDVNFYSMIDTTRGQGVITRDAISGQIVSDTDNIWNGPGDDFSPAGDAHYCTTAFYDFLLDRFNWNGLDGNEQAMVAQVNYGGKYNNNAFWLGGSNNFVALGNGNCHQHSAFTTLDIVGHEFTHGIIEASSQLVYKNESGAINESLADILGKSLEYFEDPVNFNWIVGDKIRKDQNVAIIRSMEDPNLAKDPKFYGGLHWHTNTSDQGGVHTNSGVLNYWYYLLVEGGQGINEVDYNFDVTPIGIEKALQMVFSLNLAYFTPNTTYFEAMYASLDYAESEYGIASQEYASILEAWLAVGLFPGIEAKDLTIKSIHPTYEICPDEIVQMEVYVINIGSESFESGEVIHLTYKQRNAAEVTETVTLTSTLLPDDTLSYIFNIPLQDSLMHNGTINLSIEADDFIKINNASTASSRNTDTKGHDIKISSFSFTTGNICNNAEATSLRYNYTNTGCQPIPVGDTIEIIIATPQDTFVFIDTTRIFPQINPGSFVSATLVLENPFELNFEEYQIKLRYSLDDDESNNFRNYTLTKILQTEADYLEPFDGPIPPHFTTKTTNVYVKDSVFNYQGNPMLAFAGLRSNPFFENCPDVENFFEEYNFESVLTFCLDGTSMIEPIFSFDLIQFTNADYDDMQITPSYGSIVQVKTDSTTYPLIYDLPEGESQLMEFALPEAYIGQLEIAVITNSGKSQPFLDGELDEVDAALFDNFHFYDKTHSSTNDANSDLKDFTVFPNPMDHKITITSMEVDKDFDIKVCNSLGDLIISQQNLNHRHVQDTYAWPSGIYYLSIITKSGLTQIKKVIKL